MKTGNSSSNEEEIMCSIENEESSNENTKEIMKEAIIESSNEVVVKALWRRRW